MANFQRTAVTSSNRLPGSNTPVCGIVIRSKIEIVRITNCQQSRWIKVSIIMAIEHVVEFVRAKRNLAHFLNLIWQMWEFV